MMYNNVIEAPTHSCLPVNTEFKHSKAGLHDIRPAKPFVAALEMVSYYLKHNLAWLPFCPEKRLRADQNRGNL